MKIFASVSGLVIYITITVNVSFAQIETPAKADTQQVLTAKPYVLGEYLLEAGNHLKRAYKPLYESAESSSGQQLTWGCLNWTFGIFSKGLKGPYHVGEAGEQLIGASTVLLPEKAPLMEKAGEELRTYRKLGYWNAGLFWGGLITALLGANEKAVIAAGGSAMLAGWGVGFLAPRHMGSAGERLEEISGAFPTDTQRILMEKAGKRLQAYKKQTYWGWGLQGVGITTTVIGVASKNTTVGVTGVLTTLAGMVIYNAIAPTSVRSAGERLEELGNIL